MRQILVAIIASLVSFSCPAATSVPAVEAFGRIPSVEDVVLSPGGKMLAWADSSGRQQMVVAFDLDKKTEKRRFTLPVELKLRDLDWHDDETLLATLSVTHSIGPRDVNRYEWERTLALDVVSGEMRMLLMDGTRAYSTGAQLLSLRTPKPRTVVMATWDFAATRYTEEIGSRLRGGRKDSGWVLGLFLVDTTTGKGTRIEAGTPFTSQWIVDENGDAVARTEWETDRMLSRVQRKNGMAWEEIHSETGGEPLVVYGLKADKSALLAVGPNGKERSCVWEIPMDGSGARVVLEDPLYDVEFLVLDSYTRQPVGAWIGGAKPHIQWLDPAAEARRKALGKSFGGLAVHLGTRSRDYSRVVATVSSPSKPAIYYLVDFSLGTADIVGEEYPSLEGVPLGEVRVLSYKARDGIEIPAYLTLPPGAEPRKLPLVLLPHGGPESRDDLEFDWLAQFMASRGYAVLQPQFRGSTGFGEDFRKAGYGQWGGVMQDDLSDGVKALVEQGIADPARVCIVGASYGGYAALAGAAFTPDLYACAASVNGVSDLPGMLGNSVRRGGDESYELAYWRSHIGSEHDPRVVEKSPARSAKTVRAPVLLIHGADDTVVPIRQSELMANALQKAGKSHAFVRLKGEDHWLSASATRIRVLQELEAFLARSLLPPGE